MDFWIDIAFAVLLRVLRDRQDIAKWQNAFIKIHGAIENVIPGLQPIAMGGERKKQ